MAEEVFIIDGARTPFLKFTGEPGEFAAADLAVLVGKELLKRNNLVKDQIDELIAGCVIPSAKEANIARIIALRLGLAQKTPAWTVQRNCASGLQAIDSAMASILTGKSQVVLAGGVEVMSRAPLQFADGFVTWLSNFYKAKGWAKLKQLVKFKLSYLAPVISLKLGLTDHVVNLSMGQTAEELAYDFAISRLEMDNYSLESHKKAQQAYKKNHMEEVIDIYSGSGLFYSKDNGIRDENSLAKLGALKPVFETYGDITAGNSSQVTDGAAFLLLAGAAAVKKYNLPVVAKIRRIAWSGLNPAKMGLGPAYSIQKLLAAENLSLADIDYFEINEAFAAQVLACKKALASDEFCKQEFQQAAIGEIPLEKLNIDGGAIALGHPIGASGARLVLHTIKVLAREGKKLGIASLCIGGGQGGAILLELVSNS